MIFHFRLQSQNVTKSQKHPDRKCNDNNVSVSRNYCRWDKLIRGMINSMMKCHAHQRVMIPLKCISKMYLILYG